MLLHLKFCIEWFELNSKGNSKYIWKMLWKIRKRKKKKEIISYSVSGPAAERSSLLGRPGRSPAARARVCFFRRAAHLPSFPASRLGRVS
jgi:hypothetical protein